MYNRKGKKVKTIDKIFRVYDMKDGKIRVVQKHKTGYIYPNGEWVLKPKYWSGTDFENGYALVGTRKTKLPVNERGDTISKRYVRRKHGFSDGFVVQHWYQNEKLVNSFFVNPHGANEFGMLFQRAYDFKNERATVIVDGKAGVIDTKGTYVILPSYNFVKNRTDSTLIAGNNFHQGLRDEKGKEILPPVYHNIRILPEGIFMLYKNDIPGYMDKDYNWIWRPSTFPISQMERSN